MNKLWIDSRHFAQKKYILGLSPGWESKPKINLGLDSELVSIHFGIEINKRLKFLKPISFWASKCRKNIRKFSKKSEIFRPKTFLCVKKFQTFVDFCTQMYRNKSWTQTQIDFGSGLGPTPGTQSQYTLFILGGGRKSLIDRKIRQ